MNIFKNYFIFLTKKKKIYLLSELFHGRNTMLQLHFLKTVLIGHLDVSWHHK